tara:strand:- start:194 stop:559 length:366 start_codon:yes stop_codon:yes gene_type:complete
MDIESEFHSRFADYGGSRGQDESISMSGDKTYVQNLAPVRTKKRVEDFLNMNSDNRKKVFMFFLATGVAFLLYSRERSKKMTGKSKPMPTIQSQKPEESNEDPLFQKFISVDNSKKKSVLE